MIKIKKPWFNIKVISNNVLIWIALLFILAMPFNPSMSFSLILPLIIPVYLHLIFLEKLFSRKKYFWYFSLSLITIIVFGVLAEELANNSGLRTRIRFIEEPFNLFDNNFYISSFFINAGYNPALAIIVSTLYRYFRQRQMFKLQELQEQKTQAELNLLKSQINPHFLFNTLNTLFSMASLKEDDETAKGIAQLSELMRYVLYETKVDHIKLEKEIKHIQNFIGLQKLRFSDDDSLKIKFNISENIKPYNIPPMLLIPFIENAFKHGFSVKNKNVIKIDLMIYNNFINFKVFNTIRKNKKKKHDEHSGIGIENVKRRLDLLYHGNHTLNIIESEFHFEILLKLPLQKT